MGRIPTAALLLLLLAAAQAQVTNNVTNTTSTPIHGAGHDYIKLLSETVNPANGSVSLRIQVPTPPGRGLSYPFAFAYDSNGVRHVSSDGLGNLGWYSDVMFLSQGGWSYSVPMASSVEVTLESTVPPAQCLVYKDFIFQDGGGGRHPLYLAWVPLPTSTGCTHAIGSHQQSLNGGDDYYRASLGSGLKIADADGTVYNEPDLGQDNLGADGSASSSLIHSIEDRNGNQITVADLGPDFVPGGTLGAFNVTDTLGRTLLTSSGFGVTGNTINIAGLSTPYSLTWGTASVNFTAGYTPVMNDGYCRNTLPSATGSHAAVTSITLPNGKSFTFTYNSTYGLLSRITYPTGGYVSYSWGLNSRSDAAIFEDVNGGQGCALTHDTPAVTHRYVSYDGVHIALQQDFSYSTTWSTTNLGQWTSKTTTVVTTDFVAGTSSTTVYTYGSVAAPNQPNDFSLFGAQIPVEQTVVYKDSTGATLRTVNKTWLDQYELASEQTTLDNGLTSQTTYTYGSGAQVTEKDEYDFGAGAPGALLRKTLTTYQTFPNTVIYPARATIFDRPSLVKVTDGAGNIMAQTQYVYDGTAVTATSSVTGHDYTNYSASYNNRGNATQVERWLNTTLTWLTTTNAYNDLGNLLSSTDPGGHSTSFDYTDNWSGTGCVSGTASTQAYVTQTTNALGQRAQTMYFPCTGLAQKTRDENDILAGIWGRTFSYDQMNRPLSVVASDGGETDYTYNDTPPVSMTTTTRITSSLNLASYALGDGLGRVTQTQLTSDPEGTVKVDTSYDALNRAFTVSNPYRSTTEATYGVTSYQYDALGRVTKVIPTDGTSTADNVTTSYSGNCTTVTDQAGKKRKSCVDGLGRLTQVFEPDFSGNFLYETDYQYDTLDNLTRVDQKGNDANSANWRTRTFSYDSLSRLLTATNPESGTINYTYDSDSNLLTKVAPAPNQTGSSTVTTTFSYDPLHRLTGKTYSNGDPAVSYFYDQTSYNGLTITNGKGRRTGMSDASGATAWSYDSEGRNLIERRTISGITKSISYTYNLDGSLASLTYPSGRTVTYAYSAAARALSAIDTANSINYATAATYAPQGGLAGVKYGVTGSFTGIVTSNTYDKRLQPVLLSASAPSQTVLSFSYGFGLGTNDNGNVLTIQNNRLLDRSQSFTYDQLNRVATAVSTATSGGNCWGENFSYDIWGNLLSRSAGQTGTGCTYEPLTVAATTKNQISGFCYDAAGNLTRQGACGSADYTYDAENRITTTGGVSYTYDGDGERVKKSTGTLYWGLASNEPLAEGDTVGNITKEFIFFGGKRIARLDLPGGAVHYYFSDHLGSSNVVTNATGTTIEEESDFYPFGGERVITDAGIGNNYKFTGKERDPESGLDYFGARYYSSALGRFITPDWADKPTAVPYAVFGDPQSLNLYGYVRDNPINHIDPDGHVEALQATTLEDDSRRATEGNPADETKEKPKPDPKTQNTSNVDNTKVGNTTAGALEKTMTNEVGSLSTPKKGDPDVLVDAKTALANALINNANLDNPAKVAPATGTASTQDAQIMRDAVTNRAKGGADPVEGRTQFGTTHNPHVQSRSAGNHLRGAAGRETVYEKFGPFRDSTSRRPTWIVIYNDPGQ